MKQKISVAARQSGLRRLCFSLDAWGSTGVKFINRLVMVIFCGSVIIFSGCYKFVFKRQDMTQIRRQFHLPHQVRFISFDSYPKTSGLFGREGLRITATLEFSEKSFEVYLAGLNNPELWKPVSFLNYSPSIAEEYSQEALRWYDLPLLNAVKSRLSQDHFLPVAINVKRGKYYCSEIVSVAGERMKNNPAAYQWRNLGRGCSEMTDSDYPTIRTFGLIDSENRRLYARIQFSG